MVSFSSKAASFITVTAALTLTGCTSISSIPAGTSYDKVIQEIGLPQVSCPLPDGRTRLIWSQQPMGETVWATTMDSDRRVTEFEQVLAPKYFDKLGQGQWDAAKVRCEFGEPANIQHYPDYPNRVVWEYRFMGGADNEYMMLFVSFDRQTNQMVGYSIGPDPVFNLLMNEN